MAGVRREEKYERGGGSRKKLSKLYNALDSIALVGWYSTHVHTLLCLDPGGVQTAGIQWNSQIYHQCSVWPRQWNHLDG